MACKMWFGFQFNLSDSSDDDLYRLDFDPESQGHQIKATSGKLSLYSRDHILVYQKKSSRGCLRVRPDADANHSKTICRPPLKGGRHNSGARTQHNFI